MTGPDPVLAERIRRTFGDAVMIRRFAVMAAALMAFALVMNTVKMIIEVNAPGYVGEAIKIDFTAFWAAARLGLEGKAVTAFDVHVLRDALQTPMAEDKGDMFWLYPPGWHIAVMPLGLLPFSAAYVVYTVIVITLYCIAMWPLAKPLPGGLGLVLAGPAVVIVSTLGNNSLLWTAGFAAAIAAMSQGRAALAGMFIALLTLKPQLGILIPVALVFGGYWRVAIWAAVFTAVLVLVSTLIMGVDYWSYFVQSMHFITEVMKTDLVRFGRMMTWYAFTRLVGASHEVAYPVHILVMVGCAAVIAYVWSRKTATLDLKAAAVCAAAPLATPYAYHYELTLALAAAMFLARDGFGATRGQKIWLLMLWLGPVPGLALFGVIPPVLYAAPLLTVTLIICVLRATRTRDDISFTGAPVPN